MNYQIEPRNRFFEANRRIVEFELDPGNTVTFFSEVDLSQVEHIRASANKENKPSYTAFVAKAVALALKEFPYANRRVSRRAWLPFGNPRLQRFEKYDIAIAAERDVPGAESVAFVDVLRNADSRPLNEITQWLRNLATCDINTNKQWHDFSTIISRFPHCLSSMMIRLPYFFPSLWHKFRGGAVLISSPAKYGVDGVVATWSWPLGVSFGLVKKRPVVRDDLVIACPTFLLVLNFDRRVMAGAPAAKFFKKIVDGLENAQTDMGDYLSNTHSC